VEVEAPSYIPPEPVPPGPPPGEGPGVPVTTFEPLFLDSAMWTGIVSTSDDAKKSVQLTSAFAVTPYPNQTVLRVRVSSALAVAGGQYLRQRLADLTDTWLYLDFALATGFGAPTDYITVLELFDTVNSKIVAALRIGPNKRLELFSDATGAVFPQTIIASLGTESAVPAKLRVITGTSGSIEVTVSESSLVTVSGLGMTGWSMTELRVGAIRIPPSWTGDWYYRVVRLSAQSAALPEQPVFRGGGSVWPRVPVFP
jgi:hypothetical protein